MIHGKFKCAFLLFLLSFIHPALHFKSKNWFFRLKQPYFETDVPVHVLKYLEIFLSSKAISLGSIYTQVCLKIKVLESIRFLNGLGLVIKDTHAVSQIITYNTIFCEA